MSDQAGPTVREVPAVTTTPKSRKSGSVRLKTMPTEILSATPSPTPLDILSNAPSGAPSSNSKHGHAPLSHGKTSPLASRSSQTGTDKEKPAILSPRAEAAKKKAAAE